MTHAAPRASTTPAELANPNVDKVVVDRDGYALYFSRAPIPFARPRGGWPRPHGDTSACTSTAASACCVLAALPPTPLERAEALEQLRALEHGIRIKAVETSYDSIGVDTPEDLEQRARAARRRADVRADARLTAADASDCR